MKLQGHRAPWDRNDEHTLYSCLKAGMTQEQIGERLGRTKRAIRWKVGIDRKRQIVATQNRNIEQPANEIVADAE